MSIEKRSAKIPCTGRNEREKKSGDGQERWKVEYCDVENNQHFERI